eukprot:COSAG04_NODE_1269_length_7482_cov_15.529077_6_plen_66_part_00
MRPPAAHELEIRTHAGAWEDFGAAIEVDVGVARAAGDAELQGMLETVAAIAGEIEERYKSTDAAF